jgi:uncharacterized protein YeaO (DUF488 family)
MAEQCSIPMTVAEPYDGGAVVRPCCGHGFWTQPGGRWRVGRLSQSGMLAGVVVGEISRSQTVVRKPDIRVRRVYGQPSPADGTRILVDSIWPGADESRAELGEWCKQVAPSTAMRKWYDHDPERFEEFSRRYRAKLEDRAGEGVAAPMEVGQGPNRDAPDRDQRPRDQPGRGACRPAPGLTPAARADSRPRSLVRHDDR